MKTYIVCWSFANGDSQALGEFERLEEANRVFKENRGRYPLLSAQKWAKSLSDNDRAWRHIFWLELDAFDVDEDGQVIDVEIISASAKYYYEV